MLGLSPDLILCAYTIGLFPMANDRDDPTIHWIEPRRRGVLPLDAVHIPRSLRKTLRQNRYSVTVDLAFAKVIVACAELSTERTRTWLNDELIETYIDLHERGHAHSVEAWCDERLVGGLYGVSIGAAFFGESMFNRATDASKVCLAHLTQRLRAGNYRLLDTQFVTDHLRQFGAIEIPRDDYRNRLRAAVAHDGDFAAMDRPCGDADAQPSAAPAASSSGSIGPSQSITQTS